MIKINFSNKSQNFNKKRLEKLRISIIDLNRDEFFIPEISSFDFFSIQFALEMLEFHKSHILRSDLKSSNVFTRAFIDSRNTFKKFEAIMKFLQISDPFVNFSEELIQKTSANLDLDQKIQLSQEKSANLDFDQKIHIANLKFRQALASNPIEVSFSELSL